MQPSDPSNASISRRVYFYPLPHPLESGTPIPYTPGLPHTNPLGLPDKPMEPTSTLVLTSTTKQFVDIRVFKPIDPRDPELPNEGGPRARLDWAFAGSSTSVPIPDPFPHGYTPKPQPSSSSSRSFHAPITSSTWTHVLDSRHPNSPPPDTGTMFPLSTTLTLEFGSGTNPATGTPWSYEELWADEPVLPAPTPEDTDPPAWSIVLRVDEPEYGVTGVVVRLGRYCQGIVMKGEYCTVERWEWVTLKGGKGNMKDEVGEWKRTVRIGDQFLPCGVCFEEGTLSVGGTVRYWDYRWTVEEKVGWRARAVGVDE